MSKTYGNDTVTVPAVLIRPGDPEPLEWRRAHADYVRVPVTIKGGGEGTLHPGAPRATASQAATPGRSILGGSGLPAEPSLAGFRAARVRE